MDAVERADRQFGGLAGARRLAEFQIHADRGQAVSLGQADAYRLVVRVLVADEHLQDAWDVGFLPDDQGERTKVGKPPEFGQPQAEVFSARRHSRDLQQPGHSRGGDPSVLDRQPGRVESDAVHKRCPVKAKRVAERSVAAQGRKPGQRLERHRLVCPVPKCLLTCRLRSSRPDGDPLA